MKILIFEIHLLFYFLHVIKSQNSTAVLSSAFSDLNNIDQTVVTTATKDIGTCTCDLNPFACDYLCCCDSLCPQAALAAWINNTKNVCKDKRNNK